MKHTIACTIEKESKANKIVDALKVAGFQSTEISILIPDHASVQDMVSETNSITSGSFGWLAPIEMVAVPRVGVVVAAGPIKSILTGPDARVLASDIKAGLVSLGIPESDAGQFGRRLVNSNIFLSVQTDEESRADYVEQIFIAAGASTVKRAGMLPTQR